MNISKIIKCYFLIVPVFVVNCSSIPIPNKEISDKKTTQQRQTMLDNFSKMKSCCNALNDLDYHEFPNNEEWQFSINATDSAFRFDTGLSAIKAYRLPEKNEDYKFTLASYSLCGKKIECGTNKTHLFIPVVTFLDRSFTPVFSLLPGDLTPSDPTRLPHEAQAYEFKLKIEANNQAKYVIIFTTPSLIESSVEYSFKRAASLYASRGESITGLPFGDFKVSISQSP